MTENEAKRFIQGKLDCMNKCDVFDCKNTDECDSCNYCYSQGNFGEQKQSLIMAIQALEEIQAYRAIGTVEDIQEVMALCKSLQETVCKYMDIGTVEDIKELAKNERNKTIDDAIEKFLEYGCVCVEWNNGLSKEKLVDDVLRQAMGQVVIILEQMKGGAG